MSFLGYQAGRQRYTAHSRWPVVVAKAPGTIPDATTRHSVLCFVLDDAIERAQSDWLREWRLNAVTRMLNRQTLDDRTTAVPLGGERLRPSDGCAPRRSGGFTLIELVITVVVISLIALLAFPMAEVAVQRSKEQDLRAALRQIRSGIDSYKEAVRDGRVVGGPALSSGYPPSLKILVEGVPDARVPKKDDKETKIYFMRRIPRDPMATDPTAAAEDTWGKRSYASPPDEPEEGEDVFDVYSRSTGVGLNGIPYKQW